MSSYTMNAYKGARLQTVNGKAVHLLGVKLSGDLHGLLFEAEVEQRFVNPGKKNIEVIYSFPLPWGAVLLGVDVTLGGQRLSGAVVEKKQAEARYEETLGDGNAAIMLERNHDQSYSLNLGNLAPGEHCNISLRYAQTLEFAQQGLRLLIPTVIAPHYGDAQRDGGLMPHQVPHHSLEAEHPFELMLRLHGPLAQARVASPSHPIAVARETAEEGDLLCISLARKAFLDRDFVLVIDQLRQEAMAVTAQDSSDKAQVALLASFCPRLAQEENRDTAIKILVDCSGSMQGDSIQAARRALMAIVEQLGPDQRFSLSRFGSQIEHRTRGLWKLTDVTRQAAQRWVEGLQADLGGTEMETALRSTFALRDDKEDRQSDLLLITDGEIFAIDAILEAARTSGHRIFVVGIGSSSAETHLRRLAEASGGACDFIAPGEAVEPAVLRMFARLRSPRVQKLRLQWPEGVTPAWVSALPPSVFDGETLNIFALLPQGFAGEIGLLGRYAAEAAEEDISRVQLPEAIQLSNALARMAAATHIRQLGKKEKAKASALALEYQLVTEHTNFLLLHERASDQKAIDIPELRGIPQMLPAGWGGMGSVMASIDSLCLMESGPMDAFEAMPAFARKMGRDRSPPDFLRTRQPRPAPAPTATIDSSDARLWARTRHYSGLTPLGLAEWLRLTPATEWPATYEGLRALGLGEWVLDWLQWRMAQDSGAAEATLVTAFLQLMAWQDTWATLKPLHNLNGVLHSQVQQLRNRQTSLQAAVDMVLIEALAAELQGMTATGWPEAVLSLDAQT